MRCTNFLQCTWHHNGTSVTRGTVNHQQAYSPGDVWLRLESARRPFATVSYMYFESNLFSSAILRCLALCNLYDMHCTAMYDSHFDNDAIDAINLRN